MQFMLSIVLATIAKKSDKYTTERETPKTVGHGAVLKDLLLFRAKAEMDAYQGMMEG
ncbi:MAG: hypothetical protein LUI14_00605 [Lachnospiraceae bacterium]|nr:hypothetical protein [Lachnospiraceae bacterium]